LMGIFQNNAGGAWDNAKKSFEKGVEINGEMYYKKSEPHKASVTGDTVGDPFKDTSGPSMNILIKLMSIVSLVIAPTLAKIHSEKIIKNRQETIENLAKKMHVSVASVSLNALNSNETNDLLKDAQATESAATTAEGTLAASGAMNAAGDFEYNVGEMKTIPLPNDGSITLGVGSDLYRLHEKIKANDSTMLDKKDWYTLEGLNFENGSDKLKAGSEVTLKNLSEMLTCYNSLNIKMGGYTDNSGDSTKNVALSTKRAEAAKAALVKLGIAADRIEAEGYGPQHPLVANDNKEHMAQNRRIDIRVTKK
jgi:K(+)-stimulated pyrophosphate-energized sodium pump